MQIDAFLGSLVLTMWLSQMPFLTADMAAACEAISPVFPSVSLQDHPVTGNVVRQGFH